MTTKCPFRYRLKPWWRWLIPRYRRLIRVLNKLAQSQWETGDFQKRFNEKLTDKLYYNQAIGTGYIRYTIRERSR